MEIALSADLECTGCTISNAGNGAQLFVEV